MRAVDWMVFAEQPLAETYAPIRAVLWRTGLMVLAGAALAVAPAYLLAQVVGPIGQLGEGAARRGAGQFDHGIEIATGDEVEVPTGRFDQMADELALSQERSLRITRLKQFLPPQVAEIVDGSGDDSLLDARPAEVAVVFCDLRGFTGFAAAAVVTPWDSRSAPPWTARSCWIGRRLQRRPASST